MTTEMQNRIIALEAQVAFLALQIKRADALLSAGEVAAANRHVRVMSMQASKSYLDRVGRLAVSGAVRLSIGEVCAFPEVCPDHAHLVYGDQQEAQNVL